MKEEFDCLIATTGFDECSDISYCNGFKVGITKDYFDEDENGKPDLIKSETLCSAWIVDIEYNSGSCLACREYTITFDTNINEIFSLTGSIRSIAAELIENIPGTICTEELHNALSCLVYAAYEEDLPEEGETKECP